MALESQTSFCHECAATQVGAFRQMTILLNLSFFILNGEDNIGPTSKGWDEAGVRQHVKLWHSARYIGNSCFVMEEPLEEHQTEIS